MVQQPASAARRFLIVDDSVPFLEAARGLLEREGATAVHVASTSADALSSVHAHEVDVILVDIFLGEESGLDLVAQLAVESGHPPVVLISTHTEADFADLIRESAAVGFLPKSRLSASAVADLLENP